MSNSLETSLTVIALSYYPWRAGQLFDRWVKFDQSGTWGVDVPQTAVSQVPLLCRLDLCRKAHVSHNLGISLQRVALATTQQPACGCMGPVPIGLHWVRGQSGADNCTY